MSDEGFDYLVNSGYPVSRPAGELVMDLMQIERAVELCMQCQALCKAWRTFEIPQWIERLFSASRTVVSGLNVHI